MRSQVGFKEWKVSILTHQKFQGLVKVKGSPVIRDVPASKLEKEKGKSTGSYETSLHGLDFPFLS